MALGGARALGVLTPLLQRFPPCRFAAAYGSGVFQQTGYAKDAAKPPMIDLLLVADDPEAWHRQNLGERGNAGDYSALGRLGPGVVARVQEACARVYYNSLVAVEELDGRLIKYGVISTEALLSDLRHWDYLYVAGRLQKPVSVAATCPELEEAMRLNLRSAVSAGALLLPREFTARQLFESIAQLSYLGDFRMLIGEHPDKVRNIVSGNLDGFQALYEEVVAELLGCGVADPDTLQSREVGDEELIARLPANVKRRMGAPPSPWDPVPLRRAVAGITRVSSITQSVKGIATAGVGKSVVYAGAKLKKQAKALLSR